MFNLSFLKMLKKILPKSKENFKLGDKVSVFIWDSVPNSIGMIIEKRGGTTYKVYLEEEDFPIITDISNITRL